MRKVVHSLCIITTLCIALFSCNKNQVSLEFTNAKGEVPQLTNLVFRFSKAMIPDSLVNGNETAQYINFEPEIQGRFRWESADQLVFSPLKPLQPATTYKAHFARPLFKYSKYNSIATKKQVTFNTAPLQLVQSRASWQGESSSGAYPQLDLYFNYAVKSETIADKLNLMVEGEKAGFTLLQANDDNKVSIRLSALKMVDKDADLTVAIDKGITPQGGNNGTDDVIKSEISLPSPFTLQVQQVSSEHDGADGIIRIATSQQIAPADVKTYVKLTPAVNYSVEKNDEGFLIRSNQFDSEKSYTVNLTKGLRGKIGGTLPEDYYSDITFGELEPNIRFTNSKAVYLSKKGGQNLEIQITNTPKIKIIISKIYETNLLNAESQGYYPREKDPYESNYIEEGYGDYDYANYATVEYGDVIYEKEIDARTLPKSGVGRILNFAQFEDRLPEFNGVYHVKIRSANESWIADSRIISLSDLGIIAKEGADKIIVFVNSIKNATPVGNTSVALYGSNNQLLGKGNTNNEGVAEISYIKKEFAGFKPAMLIAKSDNDFNYMPFYNTRVNTSRFEVGGKRTNAAGLNAFLYTERDMYRPGETLNYSVIVRNNERKLTGEMPVTVKFLLPNGKELKSVRKFLNEQGAVEGNLAISPAAITGSYTMEVYSGNDVLLNAQAFSVEEFMPDRIKVSARPDKEFLLPGQNVNLQINAANLFGTPAANRKYETEIQLRQRDFTNEKYNDYNFALSNQSGFFDKQLKEGVTNASGNALISFGIPAMYTNSGLLQSSFYTTVFDETGRPVSKYTHLNVYTQDAFLGIKKDWMYYAPMNQQLKIPLVALNKDGKPVTATAEVTILKKEYRTVLSKSGSNFRYTSQQENKILGTQTINVGANTTYSFTPRSSGDYEITFKLPGANSYVSKSFYCYGSFGTSANSFEVNREGNIDIQLDKASYKTGESIKALFKTPFNGKMLVTVETDKVLSHQYVEVSNRTASVDLKTSAGFVPNVYITATLIKPHEISNIPLTVANGFKNVTVEEPGLKQIVTITAEKNIRSKTSQTIKVKTTPGSFVTLSAVDNGVLQVTDFKSPDPYNYFYQKQALQVTGYNIYPLLFDEIAGQRSSTGGDLSLEKRLNPMPAKRVKILSFWSGIQKANGSGEAVFKVNIPQFSGQLRLMAVSYKDNKFGAGEEVVTIADPIVISTALPRFLSPGDTALVPVTLSNTTKKAAGIKVSVSGTGAAKIASGGSQQLNIPAQGEAVALVSVTSLPQMGIGKIKITVDGMGEKFEDETEISVRPPGSLQKRTGSGIVTGNKQETIQINTSDFIPATTNYKLIVSKSPLVEYGPQLKGLIQYPYGCTEQTISAAFPQIYFADLTEAINKRPDVLTGTANQNIAEAIRILKMRQLYNGALTLWDGEGRENWWTSAYGAHFLLEARKAGFDFDNSLLETLLGYLNNRLKTRETIEYTYNRDQNKKIAPKEVAYSLYVLSLAGRSNISAMNYYKANNQLLALDSRYLLSVAYAVSGDRKSYAALLPGQFSGEVSEKQTGGSFYSPLRDEAIALNALADHDPANKQIPFMVKHVGQELKTQKYLSTQERAFALVALGKVARQANKGNAEASVKVNGKTIATVKDGSWEANKNDLQQNTVTVDVKGEGQIYYTWEAEGVSSTGSYIEEDNFIKVRKQFYTRNGQLVTNLTFKQNDLIVIGITLEKTFSSTIENIVITDMLPAGFEIENPRIKEIPGMDWVKNATHPVSMDIRDDRINLFVDAYGSSQTYYYAVRAVSPGNYKMGPVSADAMYAGEMHSYHGAGVVRVVR